MKKVHDYSKGYSFPLLIGAAAVSHSVVLHKERRGGAGLVGQAPRRNMQAGAACYSGPEHGGGRVARPSTHTDTHTPKQWQIRPEWRRSL